MGYLNKQVLEELDTYTSLMLARMTTFFRKFVAVTGEQLEKQQSHLENLKEVIHEPPAIDQDSLNL